jgi:gliding motility-associated-like protein
VAPRPAFRLRPKARLRPRPRGPLCALLLLAALAPARAQTIANDDFATLDEDGFRVVAVLGNDVLLGLPPHTVTIVDSPGFGTASVVLAGSVFYEPDPDAFGTDSLTYRVCDAAEPVPSCDEALVVFTVLPVNDAPVAVDDTLEALAGFVNRLAVLANDTDVDADVLALSVVSPPVHGSAAPTSGADSLRYVPDPGYLGPDSLRYRACDPSGACAEATVRLEVIVGNLPPQARADTLVTITGFARRIDLLANDADPEGLALTAPVILEGPFHGRAEPGLGGALNYAPDPGFSGRDSLRYETCDTDPLPRCDRARLLIRVEDLRLPDSFSPNGDGLLDRYRPVGLEAWPGSRLSILDRRGLPVFEAIVSEGAPLPEWDGRAPDGGDAPPDVYFYRLALPELGTEFTGSITLRR